MDLQEFKKEYVQSEIGITEEFNKIYTFIDFGNVNHWFDEDRQDWDNKALAETERLGIVFEQAKSFCRSFFEKSKELLWF